MPDTSKMTPAEYAAFTGAMSHPVGQQKAEAEAAEQQARQASDLEDVDAFVRDLEDVDIRLSAEKPQYWKNYGRDAKDAILAVLREGLAAVRARAAVTDKVAVAIAEQLKVTTQPETDEPDGWPTPAMMDPEDVKICSESNCAAVATHKYGKTPLCKTHFDEIPF